MQEKFGWHHVSDICFLQSGFTSAALLTYGTTEWGSGPVVAQQRLFSDCKPAGAVTLLLTFMCADTPHRADVYWWYCGVPLHRD